MLRVVVVWLGVWAAAGARSAADGVPVFPIFKANAAVCVGTAVDVGKYVHLVTAAQCVHGVPNWALGVRLGGGGAVQPVSRVMVHPYYAPPSAEYDIAVIRVLKPSQSALPSSARTEFAEDEFLQLVKVQPKGNVTAISWDLKQADGEPKSEAAALHERKSCGAKLNMTVSSRMICADVPSGAVPGGAPLLVEAGILGVRSLRAKADGALPKVFTNIANSEIYTFIERYI